MNIYVSNLSFNTGETELTELFSSFGEVTSVKIITDRETGRSRGFGFVEMTSAEEGTAAIDALNNKQIEGRNLSVNIAREKSERSGSGYDRNGGSRSGFNNRKW